MQRGKLQKTFFFFFFSVKQSKINTIKTDVKIHLESSLYLFGGETANHVDFMQYMPMSCSFYLSCLQGDIRKMSKILSPKKLVGASVCLISTCMPILTSFQADIDICQRKYEPIGRKDFLKSHKKEKIDLLGLIEPDI